ncbi:hypothetical protein AM2_027 [Lactococcus phage AM2]|uniref:Phage protein n=8 Tax=Audreyjarvisvirus TaxID=2843351 RepID=A0A1W6JLH3_9CAUD|nr:hypothetical protein H1Z30_gp027 [Lactococcus phage AM1]YP_009905177.1 hypothetical protein H1Z34_gp030 [Lactococcus phage LW81]ARM66332.1 hypothetical protein AM2_027 [Lactococcus phage AM2]ARM66509.1 hypothetical protein AM3_027 [Lactococcus phage AM3]ARM67062.1 hypothetical protein AM8_027 [Lactococcus phage AM8]ARM67240.1 hypothetical protein AM9_027 [Lactococcus phage AM9]ARM67419.1 hypothetical protein AM11_027 [Lactococcus phage AM11]ARQ95607.1 hypothetical protein AM12_028 [Lactoc
MTKFEEEFKALTSWDWVNVDLIQKILTKFGNWHSDEEFQKMLELGGSYVIANENLIDDNKKLVKEIADLKAQLEHQDLPVVKDFVAKWIEYIKEKDNNARGLLTDLDNMPDDVTEWLFSQENDDNINLILRAWLDGYTVEKPQMFYLKNKLTGMYLYKKPLGGYGEEPASYIEDLTDDFKFTQKEIDGMDAQSYEKKDEYKGE